MNFMFRNALVFNQDLSGWCVNQIPVEPFEFADNTDFARRFLPKLGCGV